MLKKILYFMDYHLELYRLFVDAFKWADKFIDFVPNDFDTSSDKNAAWQNYQLAKHRVLEHMKKNEKGTDVKEDL